MAFGDDPDRLVAQLKMFAMADGGAEVIIAIPPSGPQREIWAIVRRATPSLLPNARGGTGGPPKGMSMQEVTISVVNDPTKGIAPDDSAGYLIKIAKRARSAETIDKPLGAVLSEDTGMVKFKLN